MNNFIAGTRNRFSANRSSTRFTVGIIISILIHGLLLSLQFGVQGFGLPGLTLPWNSRRVPTPEISIRLAQAKSARSVPVIDSSSFPEPAVQLSPQEKFDEVRAEVVAADPAPPVESPTNNWARRIRKIDTEPPPPSIPEKNPEPLYIEQKIPAPPPPPTPAIEPPHPNVISRLTERPSPFSVAPPQEQPVLPIEPIQEIKEPTPTAIPISETVTTTDNPNITNAQLEADVAHKAAESDRIATANALKAKQQADAAAKKIADLAESEKLNAESARKLAAAHNKKIQDALKLEEEKRVQLAALEESRILLEQKQEQNALALAQQKQAEKLAELEKNRFAAQLLEQQTEKKLADEKAAKKALELEEKKLTERKKEEALQQELLLKKQAEQAAEILQKNRQKEALALAEKQREVEVARQQAAVLASQKRAEELAESLRAQTLADQQKLEADIARKKAMDQARLDELTGGSSNKGTGNPSEGIDRGVDNNAGSGTLPKKMARSDLASRLLDQAKKLDSQRPSLQPTAQAERNERLPRRTFLGGVDKDVGMTMYIESWRQKIERNGSLNYSQSSRDKAHGDIVATVSIRSDGTVDNVTIIKSSGRAELDDAMRRIVRLNARYSAFPPNLARQYDVIDIRRIWVFDESLHLMEEVR